MYFVKYVEHWCKYSSSLIYYKPLNKAHNLVRIYTKWRRTLFSYELVELSENDNSVFISVLQTPKPLNHKSSRSSKPNNPHNLLYTTNILTTTVNYSRAGTDDFLLQIAKIKGWTMIERRNNNYTAGRNPPNLQKLLQKHANTNTEQHVITLSILL